MAGARGSAGLAVTCQRNYLSAITSSVVPHPRGEKIQTKTRLPEFVRKPTWVCRSKVGRVVRRNAAPAVKPIQQNNSKGFCGHKGNSAKICNTYQLGSGLITHFSVRKWLKSPSLAGAGAAYVLAICLTAKHMLASAFSSQDQLSSVTNICLPTTA